MKFEWQISYPPANGASRSQGNCFASPEIIGVEFGNRQTDRQINSLTPFTRVCGFFLSVKFATSLLAWLAGDKIERHNFSVIFHHAA